MSVLSTRPQPTAGGSLGSTGFDSNASRLVGSGTPRWRRFSASATSYLPRRLTLRLLWKKALNKCARNILSENWANSVFDRGQRPAWQAADPARRVREVAHSWP